MRIFILSYCIYTGRVLPFLRSVGLRMADVAYKWFLIFLDVYISLRACTNGQTVEIVTEQCDLIPGNPIELKGIFPTPRTASVSWNRPGGIAISSCTPPNRGCIAGNGFNVSQDMGINYTLLILAADAGRDVGRWQITDATMSADIDLSLSINLASIQVDCLPTGPIVISQSTTVPCKTECVSTNVTLTNIVQKENVGVPFPTQSSAQQCTGGFEFTTNATLDCQGLNGSYTFCYVLESGTCSYTQPLQDCISAQWSCTETTTIDFPPTTTTAADISTESNTSSTPSISTSIESSTLGNGSNLISETTDSLTNSSPTTITSNVTGSSIIITPGTGPIPIPCPPDDGILVELIVGCLLVVADIIFLVVVCCKYHLDKWRNGVTVCIVVAVILSLIVIILTATVFDKRDSSSACNIWIVGIVLLVISAVTLLVAGVICYLKCKLIKGSTVELNNKPIQMGATGNGKQKPTAS